jgi:hypothetical protein
MNHESAFPWAVDDGQKIVGNKGMTLRDYFAAKALQGLLSNRNAEAAIDEFAVKAYRMADAMLKERMK